MTLNADDASGSGVSATYYTLDGSDQTTYAGAFTVSGDGQHQVTYWSVDAMGNTEDTHTGYVNIDTTAPVTTADRPHGRRRLRMAERRSDGHPRRATTAPAAAWTTTYYTIDGGATQTYSGPFTVSTRGLPRDRLLVGRRGGQPRDGQHRLRQHRPDGADGGQRRRRRLAQRRRHRASDPGRHRRQRPVRHAVPRAGRPGMVGRGRQRLRRAGPGRSLRRRQRGPTSTGLSTWPATPAPPAPAR